MMWAVVAHKIIWVVVLARNRRTTPEFRTPSVVVVTSVIPTLVALVKTTFVVTVRPMVPFLSVLVVLRPVAIRWVCPSLHIYRNLIVSPVAIMALCLCEVRGKCQCHADAS